MNLDRYAETWICISPITPKAGPCSSTTTRALGPAGPKGRRTAVVDRETFKDVLDLVESMPVFSDHDHHLPDDFFHDSGTGGMSLDRLLEHSYVAWTGFVPDGSEESRQRLLDNARFNSYFTWFEKGLQALHGIDEPISMESWESISRGVGERYASDKDFHWRALGEFGFERLVLDTYWDPGGDNGHAEIFTPAFRIDKFMYGHHAEAVAPDDFVPWERYGFGGGGLDDWVELMRETIRERHAAGKVAAFKCAEAYLRPIDFLPDDRNAALAAFGKAPGEISREEALLFGNYIFNRCCELAGELDAPFQVHTGLAQLSGSQPMRLEPVIARYPNVRFVLFHSGFPWTHEVAGLAHNYSNVLPSLTWTATICTSAAVRALNDYIDAARSVNSITWGSDCWTAEESVGALLAWRHVVARVLAERIDAGLLRPPEAEALARKLMFENGRGIYTGGKH